jgi:type IV secretory pathway TraG/TraD family ATPase VirD4
VVDFASVQAPMLAGLIRGRAAAHKYWLSPLVAAPLTAVAGVGMALTSPLFATVGLGPHGLFQFGLGTAVSAVLGYSGGLTSAEYHGPDVKVYQRGAVVDEEPPARTARSQPAAGLGNDITVAGHAIAALDETKHFKLIGTTGTGKSTAIREILESALERGDRAVIADPDGGYLNRFHDAERGDVVLNPFDRRSVKWDLFAEIRDSYDVKQLARSLIPDHEGADRSWREYARTFFSAVTRQMHERGLRDVGELYRLLVVADAAELRALVRGTPAQPFLEEHNARMFDSIRSVTSSAVASLEHIADQDAAPFSVRNWVKDGTAGVLFVPYKAGQIAALRSSISAWMRLAIFETMDLDELPDERRAADARRLWFVVDELDALGQIDGLKDALARLRKFGGRCVLGFQSIAQVSSTYGHGEAHTIVENCGNTMIFRCSASEGGGTARFASQLIGDREVLRTTVSRSRRFDEFIGSESKSQHFSMEPVVLPSQIEQLPDLAGYLKSASDPRWRRVRLDAVREWSRRRPPGVAEAHSSAPHSHLPERDHE